MVRSSDPDIQGWDEHLCVPVMVQPSGHLVSSCCLLKCTNTHQLFSCRKTTHRCINDQPELQKAPTALVILEHWPVVGFVGGGLVVASSFPFPASAAAPSQECSGSSSGLQQTNHTTKTFSWLRKYFCWGQTFLYRHVWDRKYQNFAIFLIFIAKRVGMDKRKPKYIYKKLVKSGDTNLTVCYLDAGRPMWWSYLCDRCSTPLHLLSQPAPSLQVVDLNSSESTQWEGRWWMECMESTN